MAKKQSMPSLTTGFLRESEYMLDSEVIDNGSQKSSLFDLDLKKSKKSHKRQQEDSEENSIHPSLRSIQEDHLKSEKLLEEKMKELERLKQDNKELKLKVKGCEQEIDDLKNKLQIESGLRKDAEKQLRETRLQESQSLMDESFVSRKIEKSMLSVRVKSSTYYVEQIDKLKRKNTKLTEKLKEYKAKIKSLKSKGNGKIHEELN